MIPNGVAPAAASGISGGSGGLYPRRGSFGGYQAAAAPAGGIAPGAAPGGGGQL